ncbi:hypothetical protein BGZ95_005029 [Linnemannia exigua]|uniref:Uncharacterized protein n=1 Tax=Linnemannia exigua TaxID=604196 RepID=A0AAD4H962_9FUNG|nr:hypothetical protein BGZ95_005029 [Linnemannia exigua]
MKYSAVIVVLTTAVLSTVSAQSAFTNFTSCLGEKVGQLTVTKAALSPYPLCVGEKYCFQVDGTLTTPIIEGSWMGVNAFTSSQLVPTGASQDMCAALAANGTPCPIPAGPVSLKFCYNAPINMIKDVKMAWYFSSFTPDSKNIFCEYMGPGKGVPPTPENPRGWSAIWAKNCTQKA